MKHSRQVLQASIRWIFFGLSLLYLAWFAHKTVSAQESRIGELLTSSVPETLLAACLFASTTLLSVLGWRGLLLHLGHPVPFKDAFGVFCLTQVAKYLPGNIGHHVGRVVLAKAQLLVPAFTTASSILQEAALVALAALSVGSLCYAAHPSPFSWDAATPVDPRLVLVAVLIGGLLALSLVNALRTRLAVQTLPWLAWILRACPSWNAVGAALPPYLFIYVVNGVAVGCIASAIMSVGPMDLLLLTGAYALSWMVGFLLPGAPGGLGIRESAFVALLSSAYPADMAFAIAVLSRVATVIADLLIFLAGMAASRKRRASDTIP